MSIDLKGRPVSFVVAGDRAHDFAIPTDREHLHPKVAKALGAVEAAWDGAQKVMKENRSNRTAMADANDHVRDAVHSLYDQAGASAKATREQAAEQFEYAARQYARAIEQAQAALQAAATAAQVYDMAAGGHGVGINPTSRAKAVVTAHMLSGQLTALPVLPGVDA